MSVISETFGYDETCCKSHEFLRRACTVTPMSAHWAGDLLVTGEIMVKQSEVNDIRGGDCETALEYQGPHSGCSDVKSGIPGQYKVEATAIRTGEKNTFQYLIPKADNEANEHNWSLDLYQSTNDCGILMDGGDAYQSLGVMGRVVSICGTIDRQLFNPAAYFLDNRRSTDDDPDKGLLFSIRNGLTWEWEVRWVDDSTILATGLDDAEDISAQFREALSVLNITEKDVLSFGMI